MDEEVTKFKWLLGAGMIFLISAYFSLNELRYAVFARTVEARVTNVRETQSVGRRREPRLSIEYNFTEAGGATRSERDTVPVDWPVSSDGTIQIQYIPGVANASRLSGRGSWIAVAMFLASLIAIGVLLYKLHLEAHAPVRPRTRRK